MADYLPLEDLMIIALQEQYPSAKAKSLESRYFTIKDKLYNELLEWIRASEPMLSDHGPKHVDNVLNNAHKLLEAEIDGSRVYNFSGFDLYILCLTILFHDVGNFYHREFHNQNIQKILVDMFSPLFTGEHSREKKHIISAGRAHTGKAEDGTKDTLSDIAEIEHCAGDRIYLREIAAIVRLADELAEGPQRTNSYMIATGKISKESLIFHRYAECTHIMIDALNGRINICYEIELDVEEGQALSSEDKSATSELLTFIHDRIFKLDQERKYCGYYCNALKQIKETQVSFNFSNKAHAIDFKIEPLVLTDLTIPGEKSKSVIEGRNDLEIDTVVAELSNALVGHSTTPIGVESATSSVKKRKAEWLSFLWRQG
ncbi:MAG: hypothetical protein CMP91_11875 [Gammaproteobacteria bacterium]|nr:hypothetical protein [Gammaproteobacteria bacterium]|tara:strand:- start:14109 stop:15227 length:1119 start_codon:yes stop_codon:yes gene_type:complete